MNDAALLIKKLGGNEKTILSFAGFGDMLLSCTSTSSRNYSYGKLIGEETSKAKKSAKTKKDEKGSALTNKEFDTVLKDAKKRKFCTVKLDKSSLPAKFNDLDDTKKAELIISLIARWDKEDFS